MAAQPMMCTDVQLHVRCELPGQACAARAAVASIVDMLGRQFCVDTHRGPSVQPVLMPSSWLSPSPCTASIYMKAECMTGTALPVDACPQEILIAFGAKPRTGRSYPGLASGCASVGVCTSTLAHRPKGCFGRECRHLARMTHSVKPDEASDPVEVGPFRAVAQMARPNTLVNLVQQSRCRHCDRPPCRTCQAVYSTDQAGQMAG